MDSEHVVTEWEKCCLCQDDEKEEKLIHPKYNTRTREKTENTTYVSLASDLNEFEQIGMIPMNIDLARLDEGEGLEQTLIFRQACWHKSCHGKCDKQKLNRLKDKKRKLAKEEHPSPVKTRKVYQTQTSVKEICFFCNNADSSEELHQASTLAIDATVRKYATELQDSKLLAKLSEGDMSALDALYHRECLTDLHNRHWKLSKNDNPTDEAMSTESLALANVVSYIESGRGQQLNFPLPELCTIYSNSLQEMNTKVPERVHSIRLKEKIMTLIPDLEEHQGKKKAIVLMYKKDVDDIISKMSHKENDDIIHLVRAAQLIRKDLFSTQYEFPGTFEAGCEESSVPKSLTTLIGLIMEGSIKEGSSRSRIALSISQLVKYNSLKKVKASETTKQIRHGRDKETPLVVYVSMLLHSHT